MGAGGSMVEDSGKGFFPSQPKQKKLDVTLFSFLLCRFENGWFLDNLDYSSTGLLLHHKLLSDQIGNLLSRFSGKKITGRLVQELPPLEEGSTQRVQLEVLPGEASIDQRLRDVREKVEERMERQDVSLAMHEVMRTVAEVRGLFFLFPSSPHETDPHS